MQNDQQEKAEIDWGRDGLPVSKRFGEGYFSDASGLAEAEHVYLAGNGLPRRFRPGFQVGELGFGAGLNMLTTWRAWRESGQKTQLGFTSFEAFAMTSEDMERALAPFKPLAAIAREFLVAWQPGAEHLRLDGLDLSVVWGDARAMLPLIEDQFDAWFLDGFSPAKNPTPSFGRATCWERSRATPAKAVHSPHIPLPDTSADHFQRSVLRWTAAPVLGESGI